MSEVDVLRREECESRLVLIPGKLKCTQKLIRDVSVVVHVAVCFCYSSCCCGG